MGKVESSLGFGKKVSLFFSLSLSIYIYVCMYVCMYLIYIYIHPWWRDFVFGFMGLAADDRASSRLDVCHDPAK